MSLQTIDKLVISRYHLLGWPLTVPSHNIQRHLGRAHTLDSHFWIRQSPPTHRRTLSAKKRLSGERARSRYGTQCYLTRLRLPAPLLCFRPHAQSCPKAFTGVVGTVCARLTPEVFAAFLFGVVDCTKLCLSRPRTADMFSRRSPPPPLFFPIRPLAWPGFWGGVVCLGGGRGGGNAFAVGRRGQIHHNISRTRRTAPGIWLLAGINEGNIPHTGMARRSGLHPIEWREANRASSTGRAVACRHVLSRRPVSDEDDVQHVHPCRAQSIWEKGCGVVARHRAIGQKMTMTGKDMELP